MKQEKINLFGEDEVYTVLLASRNKEEVAICRKKKYRKNDKIRDHQVLRLVPVPKGFMDTILKVDHEFNEIADEEMFRGVEDKLLPIIKILKNNGGK